MEQLKMPKTIKALKEVSIFKGAEDEIIEKIAEALTVEKYPPGTTVFHKDDIGDAMFIIESGSVKVHDKEYVFSILKEDDVFGEYYLIDSRRRSLSVTTIEESSLLRIDQDTFFRLMAGNIHITKGILQSSVGRLRNMNKVEAELAAKNKEIEEQKVKLADLNATKDRFFSILAHDLRGPLGSIVTFFELMNSTIDQLDNTEVVELVKSVHQSTDHLMKLLENLLQWARLQTGQLTAKKEVFNLEELIRDSIALLLPNAVSKDIKLQNENGIHVTAYADRNMISSVLRNLIGNAIKFTPQGGNIKISAATENGFARVKVQDFGLGIREEDLSKLFRIDIKHTTPGTGKEKGTGLGLSLCKDFVEKNGGNISVNSSYGEGSVFEFTVPLMNN